MLKRFEKKNKLQNFQTLEESFRGRHGNNALEWGFRDLRFYKENVFFCVGLYREAREEQKSHLQQDTNGSSPTWMSDMLLRFSRNRKFLHSKEEREEKEGELAADTTCK